MERYIAKHKRYEFFKGGKHHGSKYDSNPLHAWLNNGFMDALLHFVTLSGHNKIFEVGCGEGQLMGMLRDRGFEVAGMDYDEESVELSIDNFRRSGGIPEITQGNLFDLKPNDKRIQESMLICCEVLEHVEDPERGLEIISDCTRDYFIVSVPHEPIWCMLNFLRGKYIRNFGNTPGHINHWTRKGFLSFVDKHADVIAYSTPLPWTMVLARKR